MLREQSEQLEDKPLFIILFYLFIYFFIAK